MNHFSDSSGAFPQPDSAVQNGLRLGLAALKQKDYSAAIAQLEACLTSADTATQLKAQMGLIKAYARTRQIERAIQLCQPLCHYPDAQVQLWARQTLAELTAADAATPRSQLNSPSLDQPSVSDETGFTPLAANSPGAARRNDTTGFIPRDKLVLADLSSTDLSSTERPASESFSTELPTTESLPDSTAAQNQAANQAIDITGFTQINRTGRRSGHSTSSRRMPHSPTSPLPHSPTPQWRNASRLQKWTPLARVDASGLWALQVGSLVLLFWLLRTLLRALFGVINEVSLQISYITGVPRLLLPTGLNMALVLLLLGLLAVSPWLLDAILQRCYKAEAYGMARLEQQCPEASRLLRRVCNQERQPLPTLKILPVDAPVIFSYGYPRQMRIVVSQGLFQLQEDEVATLLAAELAHLRYWDLGAMTLIGLVIQLPYLVYWLVANWGDRRRDRVLQTLAVIVSSAGYGLFWWLRWAGLLLSRVRLYYSDRSAAELTGNPNGLSRALLKLAIGMASDIQRQKQTSLLLEGFETLMPVGYRSALTLGSLYSDANLLEWDRRNPYRRWLSLNLPHPPLGNRLDLLTQYAQHWRLEPELAWQSDSGRTSSKTGSKTNSKTGSRYNPRRLLLQGAPFFGVPIGFSIGLLLWALGRLARQLRWYELAWLDRDQTLLLSCCLLGFSIGMFLRINAFFPDMKRSNLQVNPALDHLLSQTDAMPLDSQPVQFQGTLLGRRGLQNWLYRDLMLQTASGIIRLHHTSNWGWLGDLFPKALRPPELIDRAVTVTGWFRRGAVPWIDVDKIQTQQGRTIRGGHPLWSTGLAAVAALYAVYLILQGG